VTSDERETVTLYLVVPVAGVIAYVAIVWMFF
jgi:nitrate reductase NapE component